MSKRILADGRWIGPHGIGRFSSEVFSRLIGIDVLSEGPKPLSLFNLFWQPYYLFKNRQRYKLFFTPGFNALLYSPMPFIFMIHDLNHLYFPDSGKWVKRIYYNWLTKITARRAYKILTVSEYSKKSIIEWAQVPAEKVIVVSSGVSSNLIPEGERFAPGYPYLLHVGNTKVHKNVARLVEAFAKANIDSSMRLILTGKLTDELKSIIQQYSLQDRVIFSGVLSDEKLMSHYRGATAVVFPSLYEGFGLPVVEGMACGVPVLTSNVTSMPEVAGDAAVLVDPYDVGSIAKGIECIVNDANLRDALIKKGFERVKLFSWDKTSALVRKELD